ncbi:MAG: hypothetical protein F6K09_02475 [Merismopedia sp. SIO2A8]|nr:hypothetical protein [Merismopedia sp. SIO2A8]
MTPGEMSMLYGILLMGILLMDILSMGILLMDAAIAGLPSPSYFVW